mmetsp:Transcript_18100/g.20150  ORF Transcript_18100/g.20150 Transcript_18100/m.20150 type:complete len:447 (+) Transcript_18100:53-1393(+)
MSIVTPKVIKIIAQEKTECTIADNVAKQLAEDAEYRVRQIIQEAAKFMRHSKRDKLIPSDIDNALKQQKIEGLYGYSGPMNHRIVTVAGTNLFYPSSAEVTFADIIQEKLPPTPRAPSFQSHWLAIRGVQPRIPQNPQEASTVPETKTEETPKTQTKDGVEIKPPAKHVLSKELQLYFTKVTEAITADESPDALREHALNTLNSDPGIYQLLPYFTQYIAEQVVKNLRKLKLLKMLMKMAHALLTNAHIQVDPYLHQLMPPILTCLVGKRLCDEPNEDHWSLRDYAAKLSAFICQRWGKVYNDLQPRITKTLILALLEPKKPLTTHYGAMRGLAAMGPQVVSLLLLPNITVYIKLLRDSGMLKSDNLFKRQEAEKCHDTLLRICGDFLAWVARIFQKVASKYDKDKQKDALNKIVPNFTNIYKELQTIFGESLQPYILPSLKAFNM